MTARGYRQPDTLARVAILTPDHRRNEYSEGAADNTEAAFPPLDATFSSDNSSRENLTFDEASHSCCEPSQLKTRHDQVMDQTEVSVNIQSRDTLQNRAATENMFYFSSSGNFR